MKMMDEGALSVFCLELSELLKAGITPGESFLLMAEKAEGPAKAVFGEIYEKTDRGETVHAAMAASGVYPAYLLKMVRVAEATGALEETFRALSIYYRREERIKNQVRRTVGYPLLLLGIVGIVYFVFLTEVLPIFDEVFRQVGGQMQGLSRVFLDLGLALGRAKWVLLILLIVLILVVGGVYFVPALQKKAGRVFAKLFDRTKTAETIRRARMASVLSLAVSGAKDIREAAEMAREFAQDLDPKGTMAAVAAAVEEGMSLSEAAEKHGLFAPTYCRMLSIGERSGAVDTMMAETASRMEEEMQDALEKLTGAVEPAVVAVLSLGVGLLLLSVMLPLVGIMSAL